MHSADYKSRFFEETRSSILIGLCCFAVYLWTICPTVYVGDSGELTAAAHGLGIPHNSGYPLYALLGKVFCLLPFGSIGFRMNLMSAVFCAFTVALLYDLIFRITRSKIAAFASASFLGFTSIFWSQAVSAEVYALHLLFVVIIIDLVWRWDQAPELRALMLIAFISGLSFGNHLQTVMLAPAVLFLVFYHQRGGFFRPKNLIVISVLFLAALSLYLYLPLRTDSGAAITWGDPNTFDRFFAHVAAKSHRSGYVLNKDAGEYLRRAWHAMGSMGREFGFLLLFAVWGWIRTRSARWRVFFLLIVVFDFAYTVFLNTVSLEITPFNISTAVVLIMLTGYGIADLLRRIRASGRLSSGLKAAVSGLFCMLPFIPLGFNFDVCDQSRNYTAYEHAVNILRTAGERAVLFIDGDNNVFPVIYARICESMGGSLRILDRYNLVFRWPPSSGTKEHDGLQSAVERMVREDGGRSVYLSAFDPSSFPLPEGYEVIPYGILGKIEKTGSHASVQNLRGLWRRYSTASFYEPMQRDYMNRQVCAYFHFNLGKFFFQCGSPEKGLDSIRRASKIGYDDEMIHSDIGVFFTQGGFFEEAARELDLALVYTDDLSVAYNNYGYYWDALGERDKSAASFQRAVELSPLNCVYLNNLGFELLKAGKRDQALSAWKRSLEVAADQPAIQALVTVTMQAP